MNNVDKLSKILMDGGIVFIETDTIPGLVCIADYKTSIEKLYELKNRDKNKPPTIIISDNTQLNKLKIIFKKPAASINAS